MKNLFSHTDGFFERRCIMRCNHEFLEVHIIVSMSSPVDHVHTRNRQQVRIITLQVAVAADTPFAAVADAFTGLLTEAVAADDGVLLDWGYAETQDGKVRTAVVTAGPDPEENEIFAGVQVTTTVSAPAVTSTQGEVATWRAVGSSIQPASPAKPTPSTVR